jgi:hypothetical protein
MDINVRLELARQGVAEFLPQEKIIFAWRPIILMSGKWRWLCYVRKIRFLGLPWWEYYEVRDENEPT